jgi:hypothetical protein
VGVANNANIAKIVPLPGLQAVLRLLRRVRRWIRISIPPRTIFPFDSSGIGTDHLVPMT